MLLATTNNSPSSGAVPVASPGLYIWVISTVAALGGLLFGYDWVVIGGAKPFYEPFFRIAENSPLSGWVNSCALTGCLVGALAAGALSDRLGRKGLLIVAALLFAVTSIGNALSSGLGVFVAWRILGGVGIGLASSLSPMYIAEIAPAALRGRLVAINQLTIVVGILMAQFLNWFVARDLPAQATTAFIQNSWYGHSAWRIMFALTAIPSLLFFIGMFFVPESPRWLIKSGQTAAASGVLAKVGGPEYAAAALSDVQSTIAAEEVGRIRFRDLLEPAVLRVLGLGIFLAVFQQWCGINVIFTYAQEIFKAAGYDIGSTLKNIAFTGSVNMIFTFAALGLVDRSGRRPLMMFGAGALTVVYALIAVCYHAAVQGLPLLLLVLLAIGAYAATLAPVTWVVIAEIFPNRIRGAAMSLAVAFLWGACFLLTYTFPLLNGRLGPAGTFGLYSVICLVGFAVIAAKLPETKGKSLEQIERDLVDGEQGGAAASYQEKVVA